jgi:hypothetical protein
MTVGGERTSNGAVVEAALFSETMEFVHQTAGYHIANYRNLYRICFVVVVVGGGDQGPEPRLRLHCSH